MDDELYCPICGSDEIYYDRIIPEGMKHWSCYDCGFEAESEQNFETRLYTLTQIKAYAYSWLKHSLCTDALVNGEIENQRLEAFIHYIDNEKDSDNINKFLEKDDWEKYIEYSKRI